MTVFYALWAAHAVNLTAVGLVAFYMRYVALALHVGGDCERDVTRRAARNRLLAGALVLGCAALSGAALLVGAVVTNAWR